MLRILPPPVRGALALTLVLLNTIFWCVPLYAVTLARLLIPHAGWRRACAQASVWIGENWIASNNLIFDLTQRTRWEFHGLDELRRDDWYFVVANHQSWVDIFVLQRAFNRRVPFLKFFIKQELIWFPILGPAWWALDYPFMKRYSRAYLAKHPEKRGEDLETTRRKCAKFQHDPVSIINFLEGTRFTPAKHAQQESPYEHLLRPKAGGIAFALAAMNGRIRTLLDTTIVYPDGQPSFWQFLCGEVPRVVLHVETITLPDAFLTGDYSNDPAFRAEFQEWVSALWAEKDALLDSLGHSVQSGG